MTEITTEDDAVRMVDIERACLLAEMCGEGVGITLQTSELRWMIDKHHAQYAEIERQRALPAQAREVLEAVSNNLTIGDRFPELHDRVQAALAALDAEKP